MEEAHAVLERLERIERLRERGAPAVALLGELRALLREAEDWAETEGGDIGEAAVESMRSALARDPIAF
jgi:hypothetical protein